MTCISSRGGGGVPSSPLLHQSIQLVGGLNIETMQTIEALDQIG